MSPLDRLEWYITTVDNVYFYIVQTPKPFDIIVSGPHNYQEASKILRKLS